MKKKINLGIGLQTGRKNICKLLNTYYKEILEQVELYKIPVNVTIFLMYDLDYQGAKEEDFYHIKKEVLENIKIRYITKSDVKNVKEEVLDFISKKEANLFFGYGHAKGRNTIMYFALKEKMDYLMFWDDDEYPRACIKENNKLIWKKQNNVLEHLKNIEKADVTNGYHCGYVSPIPFIDLTKDVSENDVKTFVEAISNEAIDWDNLKKTMQENHGVTYANKDLANGIGAYKLKKKWVAGTNLCLNLNHLDKIPAFYNPTNARGEDTFFSVNLTNSKVIKIPTYHFHDGFLKYTSIMKEKYPEELHKIEIKSAKIEERFYRACLGWIRYKPLLMYITNRETYDQDIELVKEKLKSSIDKMNLLIKKNKKFDFNNVLKDLNKYSKRVKKDYEEFIKVNNIWNKLKENIE